MSTTQTQQKKQKIRIRLKGYDYRVVDRATKDIVETARRTGAVVVGPIPLPTKKLKVTTRKSPCGDGKATFDRYEMRIHKRLIDLPSNDTVLHNIMRLQIPKNVNIKIEMKD